MKADSGSFEYNFVGWDSEITEVKGDKTYTAVFLQTPIYKTENGHGAIINRVGDDFVIDLSVYSDTTFDLSNILPRAAENGKIIIKTSTYYLEIPYFEVIEMQACGIKKLKIESSLMWSGKGCMIRILPYGEDGALLTNEKTKDSTANSEISIICGFSFNPPYPEDLRFYRLESGEKVYVRATYANGAVTSTVTLGQTYYAACEFAIDTVPSSLLDINVGSQTALEGEIVYVNIGEIAPGLDFRGLYYLNSSGKRFEIEI